MFAALVFAAALAQTPFESYLAPVVASRDFNGVVLVARGDKVLFEKAYGKASFELDAPLTPRSRFRIASITKTFTGAAAVMLAERGKLALTDPLSKYLPDFPGGEKIQIRHLLLHQSGVGNPDAEPCSGATLDELVAQVAKKPRWFEPGKASGYSNGGYAVLARVIEKASGKPWEAFLRDEIFRPLKLEATLPDAEVAIVPMRTSAYLPGPGPAGVANAPCQNAGATTGSGSLLSTAADLHRWARAVRNEQLFKRSALEHPYGWGARKYFDQAAIEQSGTLNGSSSYVAAYLPDDLYVVVLANVQSAMLTDIGKGLAAIALGTEPPKLTPSPAAVATTAEQRKSWLGRYAHPNIGTFEIAERDGALYLRWGNAPAAAYLATTGAGKAFNRQEGAALQLAENGAIRISWGGGEAQEFVRQ